MRSISRRQFVAMLAAVPFLDFADAAAIQRESLTRKQVQAMERILNNLVVTGAVPAISYAVGNSSRILAQGAFGLRSIKPLRRMEVSTRSAMASVSKQFASAAAFLLQQRSALSVDAPLSDYLPDYVHASQMTLSQVLTMRSGISGVDMDCEAPIDGIIDESTLIANLNAHELDFTPGQYFTYSNCAYNVAGVVIARVSGMSYAQFLEQHFFLPLGMSSTYPLGTRKDRNFAQGYAPDGRGGWTKESATVADGAFASGNLVSTPGDMQRWSRSLLNATILSSDTLKAIYTVPTSPDSALTHYASGWFIEPSGVIWHGGALAGYGTVNMLFPTGHSITLLANTSPGERYKPGDTALDMYNDASIGPQLPTLLPVVRSTKPE